MLQLVRGILLTWLSMAALILGALLIGHANPQPDSFHALGFDTCGSKLCFLGIVPGVTKWIKAREILSQAGKGYADQILADNDSVTVSFLSIVNSSVHPLALTVGELIQRYGIPCSVEPSPTLTKPELLLIYPYESVRVFIDHQRVDPQTPIDRIALHERLSCGGRLSWAGFTTYEHYVIRYGGFAR